jgi:predicted kinase
LSYLIAELYHSKRFMNILKMTVGLPRSGKSTWAKQQNTPIVNPDSIRLALHGQRFLPEAEAMVWAIAKYMVKSLFLAGHNTVILDATSITKQKRDEWKSKDWARSFVVFDVSKSECLKRAQNDGDILPIIKKMALEHQWPQDSELTEKEYNFLYDVKV